MADKDPSPTCLHGQPWSVWADRLGRDSPLSDTEDQTKVKPIKGDAMKLPKQDMLYYGLCPVRDEFYLVTCNYCQRVCTPQGLKYHIETNHAQEWTNCQPSQLPDSLDNAMVLPSANMVPVSNNMTKLKTFKKVAANTATTAAATASQAAAAMVPNSLAYLLATPAAPLKPRVNNKRVGGKPTSVSGNKVPTPLATVLTGTPYDKIPSPQQPPPPTASIPIQFSPLQPTLTAPSPVSPLTPSTAITMTVAVDSSGNQTVQIHLPEIGNGVPGLADSPVDAAGAAAAVNPRAVGTTAGGGVGIAMGTVVPAAKKQRKTSTKAADRRSLPSKERELDLEKHCAVWIADVNKACTRSLTCKAHSLTLRRAVQGRSRPFDELLAEHRATKELVIKQIKDGPTPPGAANMKNPSTPLAPSSIVASAPKLGRPPISRPPPAKKLLTSLLQQSGPLAASSNLGGELSLELPSASDTVNQQQYSSTGLLQRVAPPGPAPFSLTFTPHHPKPLAVCSFGLRRPAGGRTAVVLSDRKWDYLRSTLRATLQRTAAAKANAGLQSLLRPSIVQQQQHQQQQFASSFHQQQPLQPHIELPNGLQLSIGVQPDGNGPSHHRVRFKKGIVNGQHQLDQQSDDLMEGFDGLVGEDGVLTFLNQGTEGTASLSLMADLSAGNITFSELNQQAAGAAAAAAAASSGKRFLPTGPKSGTL